MPGFLPDTSCMVAAVCAWHERHADAVGEIGRRLQAGEVMFVAAPAVIESYAVLTRLPPPHRISPAEARRVIEGSFTEHGRIIALDGGAYRTLLRLLVELDISGGRSYDAVIAECALQERDVALLTFNDPDFSSFSERGLTILVPRR